MSWTFVGGGGLRLTFFWGWGGVQITNRPKPDRSVGATEVFGVVLVRGPWRLHGC